MHIASVIASAAILAPLAAPAQAVESGAAIAILQGTPRWVYLLLAFLIVLGLQATRPRVARLPRILITPAIFIAWGIASLVAKASGAPLLALAWLAAGGAGAALALLTVRVDDIGIDRDHGLVRLPASWLPLIRNVLIFAAKYAIAVAAARRPEAAATLALWDIAVSGASTGYFLGRLARLAGRYRSAPSVALATGSPS
jgi:hypothetical protein